MLYSQFLKLEIGASAAKTFTTVHLNAHFYAEKIFDAVRLRPPVQDLHSVQQVAPSGRGVSGVGRLLSGRRGESLPDGVGHPASVRGHPAPDGLHPHRSVPDPPAGGPAVTHALQRHGQHSHGQQKPPLGSGQCHHRKVSI